MLKGVLICAALAAFVAGCGYSDPYGNTGPAAGLATGSPCPTPTPTKSDNFKDGSGIKPTKLPDGLQIIELRVGTCATATPGDNLSVQYTGWLSSGKKFDSSRDRGQAFTFTLGKRQVIAGWDEGVAGMKIGGKRKLIIPAKLGYGAAGSPPTIPPNAELVFEIELLSIGPATSPGASPSAGP